MLGGRGKAPQRREPESKRRKIFLVPRLLASLRHDTGSNTPRHRRCYDVTPLAVLRPQGFASGGLLGSRRQAASVPPAASVVVALPLDRALHFWRVRATAPAHMASFAQAHRAPRASAFAHSAHVGHRQRPAAPVLPYSSLNWALRSGRRAGGHV